MCGGWFDNSPKEFVMVDPHVNPNDVVKTSWIDLFWPIDHAWADNLFRCGAINGGQSCQIM